LAPGVVRCPGQPYSPGCVGGELYIALQSGLLFEYLETSLASCSREFRVALDGEPTALWLGHEPFTVYEPAFSQYSVYLRQGSNLDQYRRQLGHEAFHRVCGPGIAHWVHEILAELFTFVRLREAGHVVYAATAEAVWAAIAPSVSLDELHQWSGGVGEQYYARAFTVGIALVERCGWQRTCELVQYCDARSRPDPEAWLAALPADMALDARRIMGL
jgi:hypothetical protein